MLGSYALTVYISFPIQNRHCLMIWIWTFFTQENDVRKSSSFVGHQYIWVGQTKILNFASLRQNVRCSSLYVGQFNEWVGQISVLGLRLCSGQTTHLSPLVRSPVRFILMWTRSQSSCEKSIVNALPTWVFSGYSGFLPQGKLTGWVRFEGH